MIIEERGQTKEGFEYIIGIHPKFGHRLGYVGVYTDSPLYNVSYSKEYDENEDHYETSIHSLEYNVHVHGGLTYSGSLNQNVIGASNPHYFGFDCAHLDDGKISISDMQLIIEKHCELDKNQQQKLLNEYKQMFVIIQSFNNSFPKSLEFVRNECNHLSEQLKELETDFKILD